MPFPDRIHGFFTPFHNALEAAGYYEDDGEKKIVICGDLFDRGVEAKKLQGFVLETLKRDQIILIRGNHEDLFCDLVTKDRGLPYNHHIHNGTYQTALDLTGFDIGIAGVRHFDFAEAARNTSYYREYWRGRKIDPASFEAGHLSLYLIGQPALV